MRLMAVCSRSSLPSTPHTPVPRPCINRYFLPERASSAPFPFCQFVIVRVLSRPFLFLPLSGLSALVERAELREDLVRVLVLGQHREARRQLRELGHLLAQAEVGVHRRVRCPAPAAVDLHRAARGARPGAGAAGLAVEGLLALPVLAVDLHLDRVHVVLVGEPVQDLNVHEDLDAVEDEEGEDVPEEGDADVVPRSALEGDGGRLEEAAEERGDNEREGHRAGELVAGHRLEEERLGAAGHEREEASP